MLMTFFLTLNRPNRTETNCISFLSVDIFSVVNQEVRKIISKHIVLDIVNWSVKLADKYNLGVQYIITQFIEVNKDSDNYYRSMELVEKELEYENLYSNQG